MSNEALRLAEAIETAIKQTDQDDQVIFVARWFAEPAAALLRQQAEQLDAELCNREVLDKMLNQCIAERDQLRAEVERYRHLRNGQSWPAVFATHDAPEPLRGGELDAAIDAARTHKETK